MGVGLALEHMHVSAAHDEASAVLLDDRARAAAVGFIGIGIVDIDISDQISAHSLSPRANQRQSRLSASPFCERRLTCASAITEARSPTPKLGGRLPFHDIRLVIGTRPEAIKLAPVAHALAARDF